MISAKPEKIKGAVELAEEVVNQEWLRILCLMISDCEQTGEQAARCKCPNCKRVAKVAAQILLDEELWRSIGELDHEEELLRKEGLRALTQRNYNFGGL